VQHSDDGVALRAANLGEAQTDVIRGSGVEMDRYVPTPEPTGAPVVLLASRMLWDKGVGDFVAAAQRLRAQGLEARFALAGSSDPGNPSTIPLRQLEAWHAGGTVEWWGQCDDMPATFASTHVVVLPSSYGEGVPRVLIEAAACARPIVATDVPGCREIARHGDNGLLVPLGNVPALADAMRRLIEDPAERRRMGARSREIAEGEFSLEQVARETLAVYQRLLRAAERP
jgi:glycosyltransferase involved in cell wall biosynthesis